MCELTIGSQLTGKCVRCPQPLPSVEGALTIILVVASDVIKVIKQLTAEFVKLALCDQLSKFPFETSKSASSEGGGFPSTARLAVYRSVRPWPRPYFWIHERPQNCDFESGLRDKHCLGVLTATLSARVNGACNLRGRPPGKIPPFAQAGLLFSPVGSRPLCTHGINLGVEKRTRLF